MGVAGCGKSTLASKLAEALGLPFIEGDDFHPAANLEKMQQGIALDDRDREGWLDELGRRLQAASEGAVLSCSALKRSYRERLRGASAGLGFIYLNVSEEVAALRVGLRGPHHLFPAALVSSQFAALEAPGAEPGVLELDGSRSPDWLLAEALRWSMSSKAQAAGDESRPFCRGDTPSSP